VDSVNTENDGLGGGGPGINPFYFRGLSRSLAAMLQQGNTKTATDRLDGVWGELSARQREEIRALLNRYGVKYKVTWAGKTDTGTPAAESASREPVSKGRELVIADTSLFEPTILKNFNTARKKLVEFARAHFPAAVVNAETGKTIGISRIGIDKFLSGNIPYEKYASGFHIPELIERAHKVGDANNYHPETAGAIPTFEYYDSPIEIDGKSFNAHIRVKNTQIGDKYYGHTVSEIEDIKIEPPTRSSVPGNPVVHPENTGGSMKSSARTSVPETPAVQPVNAIDDSRGRTRTARDTMPSASKDAAPVINAQSEPPQSFSSVEGTSSLNIA